MTLTPDRIDELDFPTPNLLEEPNFDEIPYNDGTLIFRQEPPTGQQMAEAITESFERIMSQAEEPWMPHGGRFFCNCSPSRGGFFERYREAALAGESELTMTYRRWEPEPASVMSKELVRIRSKELAVIQHVSNPLIPGWRPQPTIDEERSA